MPKLGKLGIEIHFGKLYSIRGGSFFFSRGRLCSLLIGPRQSVWFPNSFCKSGNIVVRIRIDYALYRLEFLTNRKWSITYRWPGMLFSFVFIVNKSDHGVFWQIFVWFWQLGRDVILITRIDTVDSHMRKEW